MGKPFLYCIIFVGVFFSQLIDERSNSYRGPASSWTIIPSRSLAGLHYIFKGYEEDENRAVIRVTGPVVEITNGDQLTSKVFPEGFTSEMDPEDFEAEQELGQSVFEATTGAGTGVGTAFLVGQNIVLTNRHIMGLKPNSQKWSCGKFSIKLNHKEEKVDCERVRFCSKKYDYCVIELKKMKNKLSVGHEVKSLRLEKRVSGDRDLSILHIGNAAGMGLQASRGRGITVSEGEFYHYAPTLGGSSGAPLFNEKGQVIGINWGHTGGDYIDDASFSRGILAKTIFLELSRTHIHTLKEIKSFRSWHHRKFNHRNVRIDR